MRFREGNFNGWDGGVSKWAGGESVGIITTISTTMRKFLKPHFVHKLLLILIRNNDFIINNGEELHINADPSESKSLSLLSKGVKFDQIPQMIFLNDSLSLAFISYKIKKIELPNF